MESLVFPNKKVTGKCITDVNYYGNITECGSSGSKVFSLKYLDEDGLYLPNNYDLNCEKRINSPELSHYTSSKGISENKSLQTPEIPDKNSFNEISSPFMVFDKKILYPPFRVSFKKESKSTQYFKKIDFKTNYATSLNKSLFKIVETTSQITTTSSEVTCSKVTFNDTLLLNRYSKLRSAYDNYQASLEGKKLSMQCIQPIADPCRKLGELESKEVSVTFNPTVTQIGAPEINNVITEKKDVQVKSVGSIIRPETYREFAPTAESSSNIIVHKEVELSSDDIDAGCNCTCFCDQKVDHNSLYRVSSSLSTLLRKDILDETVVLKASSSCSSIIKSGCYCSSSFENQDDEESSNESCSCVVSDCLGAIARQVMGLSTYKAMELKVKVDFINLTETSSCVHIIDLPNVFTVVVHNTSSPASNIESAKFIANLPYFSDAYNSFERARRLKIKNMLLKQQEINLKNQETEKNNVKSFRNYVKIGMSKLRNRLTNLKSSKSSQAAITPCPSGVTK